MLNQVFFPMSSGLGVEDIMQKRCEAAGRDERMHEVWGGPRAPESNGLCNKY